MWRIVMKLQKYLLTKIKHMKLLTDPQYEHLQDIARENNIALYGYTVRWNSIHLSNSKRIIIGDSMQELIEKLSQ